LLRGTSRAGFCLLVTFMVGGLFRVTPATADTISISASDTGTYTSSGFHLSSNKNYTTGISGGTEDRSYFVFNIPSISAPIVSVQLQLTNPLNGYTSPDPFETFQLFDVLTSIPLLEATNVGSTSIFNDLGSGISYGTRTVSVADNGTLVTISLNSAAMSAITTASGSALAFGGALTSLGGATNEFVFGFTGTGTPTRSLVITTTTVPEPSALASLSVALLLWAGVGLTRGSTRSRK